MPRNPSDAHPPSMRHRAVKDRLGILDPERGAPGGRAPAVATPLESAGFPILPRTIGASRAIGYRVKGSIDIETLRSLDEKLEAVLAAGAVRVIGPVMTVLEDDPLHVMPPHRSRLVCRPIRGSAPTEEGLERIRLVGGAFLALQRTGPVDDLEAEYGFVLGRWLEERRYVLSTVQIREVYPRGIEVDDPSRVPMEILFPISPKLMPDEPGFT